MITQESQHRKKIKSRRALKGATGELQYYSNSNDENHTKDGNLSQMLNGIHY